MGMEIEDWAHPPDLLLIISTNLKNYINKIKILINTHFIKYDNKNSKTIIISLSYNFSYISKIYFV
jgi:hypothetical protein